MRPTGSDMDHAAWQNGPSEPVTGRADRNERERREQRERLNELMRRLRPARQTDDPVGYATRLWDQR